MAELDELIKIRKLLTMIVPNNYLKELQAEDLEIKENLAITEKQASETINTEK